MKREGYYNNIWEFFHTHTDLVQKCPRCVYTIEKHFYSLYHIEVFSETFPDVHFSFHIPYPLGKQHLPKPVRLPKVEHVEQDGSFRFGRSLFPVEKTLHREQDVFAALDKASAEVQALFGDAVIRTSIINA